MKKKTVLIVLGMIVFGYLAYLTGYYFMYQNAQASRQRNFEQRNVSLTGQAVELKSNEYYFVRIENKMLNIYKMPENILYDSINLISIHRLKEERELLNTGMTFEYLTEVFEFLESSMS